MRRRPGWRPDGSPAGVGQSDVRTRTDAGGAVAERVSAALVELVGDADYGSISIEAVCEAAGVSRAEFDSCYLGKEDCFLRIHRAVAEELCFRVNAACAAPSVWRDRVWAAGWATVIYLRENPRRARFLLCGINGAGERAQAGRDRMIRGIVDLLDGARLERGEAGRKSRCTAEVTAAAIYTTLLTKVEAGAVARGEHFLPELVYIATAPFLGAEEAEAALRVRPLGGHQ